MSNKKNEDIEMRAADGGNEFAAEKDPFLGRSSPVPSRSRGGSQPPVSIDTITNSPLASILAYCLSSISMTVVNKYVVSGSAWNLNFFYLAIQVGGSFLTLEGGKRDSRTIGGERDKQEEWVADCD